MLVETLGDQAGRTDPWEIRANGDRGSQSVLSHSASPLPWSCGGAGMTY